MPPKPLPSEPRPDTFVFGGVCRFPKHPDADMHGLVRAVCRARLFSHVIEALARYGVEVHPRDLRRTWEVSSSTAERAATEGRHGVVLVSSLARAYLAPESYQPVPVGLLSPLAWDRSESHRRRHTGAKTGGGGSGRCDSPACWCNQPEGSGE